jgi:predicted phosphodiesterase
MLSIAIISDIHGNLPALEAVVARLDVEKPDAVYVAGDLVNGCPWSGPVIDLIAARGWYCLQGNHDDAVLQLATPRMEPRYAYRALYGALWWTREHLNSGQLSFLEQLPLSRVVTPSVTTPLRIVHGVPGNFFLGFRHDAPEKWCLRFLADVPERVVAAGHTHDPMVRKVSDCLLVNSGSVGAPYDGDTRASYAWLETNAAGWRARIERVPYDHAAVESGFRDSGLLAEGGVMADLFCRSILTGQPWVADFVWWMREQPAEALSDMPATLARYDSEFGPGRWAFPHA